MKIPINFRLEAAHIAKLKKIAKKRRMTVSDLIRMLIDSLE